MLNRKYNAEFGGDFEKLIASFVELDFTIDLVQEVGKTSQSVARKFKLSKEKADENIDEETGQARYYTTKQYCQGTWVVNTWRRF
jgi:hypothetical protein